ncbi:MAG: hypothetical protein L6Q77_00805 [Bacteroidetes bacterium]|nr:hypothetical protein [Bacteroidota bacterium]
MNKIDLIKQSWYAKIPNDLSFRHLYLGRFFTYYLDTQQPNHFLLREAGFVLGHNKHPASPLSNSLVKGKEKTFILAIQETPYFLPVSHLSFRLRKTLDPSKGGMTDLQTGPPRRKNNLR